MSHKIQSNHFINGSFVSPSPSADSFVLLNPATEEPVATIPCATKEEIDSAVEAAKRALPIWQAKSPAEKAAVMRKFGQLVKEKKAELGWLEAQSMGRPSHQYVLDVEVVARAFNFMASLGEAVVGDSSLNTKDHINFTLRQPFGVTAGILPFNVPIIMWANKVAPSVAAGNAIIIKSSEKAPLTPLFLNSLTVEAGFPAGLINTVSGKGPTGKFLSEHMEIRKLSFTGSTRTGRLIAQAAASSNLKNISLELGGKSPTLIFQDADLESCVEGTAWSVIWNSGQICMANSRIYVEESIAGKFLEMYKAKFGSYKQGDPLGGEASLGPQADSIQHDTVMAYLKSGKEEGGKVELGGGRFGDKGAFIQPTIFTGVSDDARINREEIFGPVTIIHTFKTEEEAIRRANDTEYGLYASVYTKDIDRAMRVSRALEAGTVGINTTSPDTSADMPFGGWKTSGIGREGGLQALEPWLETKSVILKYKSS